MSIHAGGRPMSPQAHAEEIVVDVHAVIEDWERSEIERESAECRQLCSDLRALYQIGKPPTCAELERFHQDHYARSIQSTRTLAAEFRQMAREIGARFATLGDAHAAPYLAGLAEAGERRVMARRAALVAVRSHR